MSADGSLDVLIAQLQVQIERLASVLVTSPRRTGHAQVVAERIVSSLQSRGVITRLHLPATSSATNGLSGEHQASAASNALPSQALDVRTYTPAQVGTPLLARTMITEPSLLSVAAAPGILDDTSALFFAAAADVVLMVVSPGHTRRDDLQRAAWEIETAGGRLVGAVLYG